MPLKIMAKDSFKVKNVSPSAPLTDDQLEEVIGLLTEVEEYTEPIETPYGLAYLMEIPNKPQAFQSEKDDAFYSISLMLKGEFVSGFVGLDECVAYENHPACLVWMIGKVFDRVKDNNTYKNFKQRAMIFMSDKPEAKEDKQPVKVARKR